MGPLVGGFTVYCRSYCISSLHTVDISWSRNSRVWCLPVNFKWRWIHRLCSTYVHTAQCTRLCWWWFFQLFVHCFAYDEISVLNDTLHHLSLVQMVPLIRFDHLYRCCMNHFYITMLCWCNGNALASACFPGLRILVFCVKFLCVVRLCNLPRRLAQKRLLAHKNLASWDCIV